MTVEPSFFELYGQQARFAAEAPGRVNLIGEHTDYSGGYVLPLAIPRRTRIELAPRPDATVRAWSANIDAGGMGGMGGIEGRGAGEAGGAIAEYQLGAEAAGRGWLDYVQGATRVLGLEGVPLAGADLRIESTVPSGAGLASSAALVVAVLRALRAANRLEIDDVALARLGQRVENQFVGAPVGIMDPMAASLADETTALFIDTRSLTYERVPLPPGVELAVVDSGIAHRHAAAPRGPDHGCESRESSRARPAARAAGEAGRAGGAGGGGGGGGDYRARREECDRAARLMGVDQLRELGRADLPRLGKLPPPLDRRARHVISENARVLAAVRAMRHQDAPLLGKLLYDSHRSLAEDFAVSLPELDLLVELARGDPDVLGARLTGGGFGGAVLALTRQGAARAAGNRLVALYGWRTSRAATLLLPAAP
ncbi:MAG TPA: galactokinase family protein [Thermoanaerobaculia bacterium]|nr:galactokinase family protein [Thermoanaerobaculia bacterium]